MQGLPLTARVITWFPMESEGMTSTICSWFQSVLMIVLTLGSGNSVFFSLVHWLSGPNSRKKRKKGKVDREYNYRQLNSLPVKQSLFTFQMNKIQTRDTSCIHVFLILVIVICLEDVLIELDMLTCVCVPSDACSCTWDLGYSHQHSWCLCNRKGYVYVEEYHIRGRAKCQFIGL